MHVMSFGSPTIVSAPHPLHPFSWGTVFVPSFGGASTDTQYHWIPVDVPHQSELLSRSLGAGFPGASTVVLPGLIYCFVVLSRRLTGASRQVTVSFNSEQIIIEFRPSAGFLLAARVRAPCFLVGRASSQQRSATFLSSDSDRSRSLYFPPFYDRVI